MMMILMLLVLEGKIFDVLFHEDIIFLVQKIRVLKNVEIIKKNYMNNESSCFSWVIVIYFFVRTEKYIP